MELRKKIPSVQEGDVIFVCRKGCGVVVGAFLVLRVTKETVDYLCQEHVVKRHCVPKEQIEEYAKEKEYLYGLELLRLIFDEKIRNEELGLKRNPQNFCRVKSLFYYRIPKHILWA